MCVCLCLSDYEIVPWSFHKMRMIKIVNCDDDDDDEEKKIRW